MKAYISIFVVVFMSGLLLLRSYNPTPDVIVEVISIPEDIGENLLREPIIPPEEIECLALNIYHEARGDNYAGKLAVADVTLNRVESTLFPNTICSVVKQTVTTTNWLGNVVPSRHKCQFSWYCDGKSDVPKNPEAWEISVEVATSFISTDRFRGVSEGSTHYHAKYVEPNWISDRGMRRIGTIGSHIFYKWH